MKNLKIAQIVPLSCLHLIKNNAYHMCLAHLVKESDQYTMFYNEMSIKGKYVLMDNGAAEGSQLSFDELLDMYDRVNPTEIVLPDTLHDSRDTINKSIAFYDQKKSDIKKYKLMVVPQGETFEEWCNCADELLNNLPANTIGISKFLEMKTGDPAVRLKAVKYLKKYDKEIHLLGCSDGPAMIYACRIANDHVRGCDSAFTYICAKAGLDNIYTNTDRPDGEIQFLTDPELDNLDYLMCRFEISAGVSNNYTDSSWGLV